MTVTSVLAKRAQKVGICRQSQQWTFVCTLKHSGLLMAC